MFTALYGYGKGLPIYDEAGTLTGSYTRRLTFGSVNNGVNWVGDEGRVSCEGAGTRLARRRCTGSVAWCSRSARAPPSSRR